MKCLILLLCCIIATLAGCSSPVLRGIVAKKQYRPAWVQFVSMSTGKTTTIVPIHHPEQWDFVIQPDGTNEEDRDSRVLVVVSRKRWESLEVGDIWERADTVREGNP